MSRDDEIDYRVMYPLSGRTRKRRAANPRPKKEPEKRGGFFSDEPNPFPTKARVQKDRTSETAKRIGRRDPDGDGAPMPSMRTVARAMIAEDLDRTVDEVMARLEAKGYEAAPITISTYRQEIMDVLRLCKKHGSITVPAWQDDE